MVPKESPSSAQPLNPLPSLSNGANGKSNFPLGSAFFLRPKRNAPISLCCIKAPDLVSTQIPTPTPREKKPNTKSNTGPTDHTPVPSTEVIKDQPRSG